MTPREAAAAAVAALALGAFSVAAGRQATIALVVCYLLLITGVFFGVLRRKSKRFPGCKMHGLPLKRQISQDAGAFSFGAASAPALFVSSHSLSFFEEEVGKIYSVFGPEAKPVQMRSHLDRLHKILGLPHEEEGLSEPIDDILLARFLVARDFDVEKAAALVKGYCQWRRELCGGVVPSARSIAQDLITVPFEDRKGRPVVMVKIRNCDPTVPAKSFQRFYRAIVDVVSMHSLCKRTGNISPSNTLEQYLLVIDMEGAGFSNFSLQGVQLMVAESNTNYPDRLSQVYVLGCNATVLGIWHMTQQVIHPRTRRKVQLISSSDVRKTMMELVDPELLPPHYGGSAPAWPRTGEAKTLDEKAGPLAAEVWRRTGVIPETEASGRASVLPRGSRGFLEKYDIAIVGMTEDSGPVARSLAECSELVVRVEALLGPGPQPGPSDPDGARGCIAYSDVLSCFGFAQFARCHARAEARTAGGLEEWLNKMLGMGGEAKAAVLNFVSSSSARLPPSPPPSSFRPPSPPPSSFR